MAWTHIYISFISTKFVFEGTFNVHNLSSFWWHYFSQRLFTISDVVRVCMQRTYLAYTRFFWANVELFIYADIQMMEIKNFAHESLMVKLVHRDDVDDSCAPEKWWYQRDGIVDFDFATYVCKERKFHSGKAFRKNQATRLMRRTSLKGLRERLLVR